MSGQPMFTASSPLLSGFNSTTSRWDDLFHLLALEPCLQILPSMACCWPSDFLHQVFVSGVLSRGFLARMCGFMTTLRACYGFVADRLSVMPPYLGFRFCFLRPYVFVELSRFSNVPNHYFSSLLTGLGLAGTSRIMNASLFVPVLTDR